MPPPRPPYSFSPLLLPTLLAASFLLLAIITRLLIGGTLDVPAWAAILDLRAQRVAVGLIVGASLAAAGAILQALLRNPLAGPEVLGVSSGASLAVVLTAWLGIGAWGGSGAGGTLATATLSQGGLGAMTWLAAPALVGSLLTLALVYGLSQQRGIVTPNTLVLTGVVVGVLAGAGVMFVQHVSGGLALGSARVLVGELTDDAQWPAVGLLAIAAAVPIALAAWLGPALDASTLGDDEAASVGVRLAPLRTMLVLSAGVLIAAAVTLAGPVGFVGLIAPHIARRLTRHQGGHRALILIAALIGAGIVIAADALTKAIHLGAGRMPLGIVTALLGGPAFLIMVRRNTRGQM